jgi:anti-anti-sigma regulatory factor
LAGRLVFDAGIRRRIRRFERYVICGSDIKATDRTVIAFRAAEGSKPNVSEAVFRSTSLPATAEEAADINELESEQDPFQATTVAEQTNQPSEADAPLKITGEQTIRNADQLHKTLSVYLDRGQSVVVDLAEVNACDAASLQLICALHNSAVQRKLRFRIQAASPAIAETAAALGLRFEALATACGPSIADGDCELAGKENGI